MHAKWIALALSTLIGGCGTLGTARLVSAGPDGGEIELHGAYMPAATAASLQMGTHCDSPFRVLRTDGDGTAPTLVDMPARGDRRVTFLCAGSAHAGRAHALVAHPALVAGGYR